MLERGFAHVLMQAVIRYWSVLCTACTASVTFGNAKLHLGSWRASKRGSNSDGLSPRCLGARKKVAQSPTSPGFSEALQWCMGLGRSIRIMISKATALSIRSVRLCLSRHQALEETGGLAARGEGFAMRKFSIGQHRALLEAGP